ncbi:MAG: hypothetical protein KDB00_16055 [Planctomycetales bacterium]|nr:hypothetical protein [Planctomycetales bacterium]
MSPAETDHQTLATVLLWKAAECRGIKLLWSVLTNAYADPVATAPDFTALRLHWIRHDDESAVLITPIPDPPIP